jgi:hypothetical protein
MKPHEHLRVQIILIFILLLLQAILTTGCAGNWDGSSYKHLPDKTHWYYRR